MTRCTHPVATIQDLIDQLKLMTRARDEVDDHGLPYIWNQLEDMLVMLATSRPAGITQEELDLIKQKSELWDQMQSLLATTVTSEKTDADTEPEAGGVNQDRGSDHSDGAIDPTQPSEDRDQCPEAGGDLQGGSVRANQEGEG